MTRPTAFYQVYASGYHAGGLAGLGETAPYLAWLGVDALVTQPVNCYPQTATDRYYSPSDHGSIDPTFGGTHAIQSLNRALREHRITPVGDLVVNHVDRAGWLVSRAITERDRYGSWLRTSTDPERDGWPGKLINIFGRSQWVELPQLGAYVATPFYEDQYALNFQNPDVISYLTSVAGHQMLDSWGYGALRLDAAASIQPADLTDAPEVTEHGPVAPHPVALSFIEHLRASVLAPRGSWAIAEAGGSPEYMRALMASPAVDYAYDVSWWAVLLHAIHTGHWNALRAHIAGQHPTTLDRHIRHVGSHDERQGRYVPERDELIAAYGGRDGEYVCFDGNGLTRRMRAMLPSDDAHVMVMGLTLTMPGVPLCYQGDMEGLHGDSDARTLDPRDPNRCRMPWDAELDQAGWGAARSPYPLDPHWRTHSIAQQRRNPASVLNRTRRTLYLRREMESIRTGTYAELSSTHPATFAYSRHAEGHDAVVIIANATGENVTTSVDLAEHRQGQRLVTLDTTPIDARETTPVRWHTGTHWATGRDYRVSLAPHEMRVIRVVSPAPRRAAV